jgi:tight adherence protein B
MSHANLISILSFFALLLFLLGLFVAIRERVIYRGRIQSRLKVTKTKPVQSETELFDLRQGRSLTANGSFALSLVSLNTLIVQSGTTWGLWGVLAAAAGCGAAGFSLCNIADLSPYVAAPVAALCGVGLPIFVLRAMRDGRQRLFEQQLPDAIDTLVRGLKAGHAVSVAVSAVAQNMPDPVGGEFRLTAAEMTYGLDLETAMSNLHTRVGQPDLGLIALAVSIQSRTGGNLAEVLSNMSRIIRERFKLRRKARALAAEGRFSALVLSTLPILLFAVIWFMSPGYYKEVWDNFYTKFVLFLAFFWMMLGNYIMYRMVRIRV